MGAQAYHLLIFFVTQASHTMAIGGDSWGVVVRHTFVEVVQTDNKHARAKSEGGRNLPVLPDIMSVFDFIADVESVTDTPTATVQTTRRESSRSRPASSKLLCTKLCKLTSHPASLGEESGKRFEDMQDSLAHGVASRDTRWHVVNSSLVLGVGFRREPLSDGPRMKPEDGVRPGDSFRVSEQQVGQDGILHLRTERGWLPCTKLDGSVLCARVRSHRSHSVTLPTLLTPSEQQPEIKEKSFSWDDETEMELCGQNNEHRTEHRTTVVITNIASDCSRDGLLCQLDAAGLAGQYDFVYLPVSFETLATHGYGIVNFVSTHAAQLMMKSSPSSVSFSDQRQGLEGHVANFQDSSLMHEGVPDQFKPLLFSDGKRIPFPSPTRVIRMPRELKRALWRLKNGELADTTQLQVSDVATPTAQSDLGSPCSLISPHDRRGSRNVANSRRARSRRGRSSLL